MGYEYKLPTRQEVNLRKKPYNSTIQQQQENTAYNAIIKYTPF